jgi:hypothetical protein
MSCDLRDCRSCLRRGHHHLLHVQIPCLSGDLRVQQSRNFEIERRVLRYIRRNICDNRQCSARNKSAQEQQSNRAMQREFLTGKQ